MFPVTSGLNDFLRAADLLVVGAGLFGLAIAERAASEAGARVVIIERRPHIGGNTFSTPDPDTGIEVHRYGTHIFHTSNERVWEYVGRFATFNNYRHHVLAVHGGRVFSMPINLGTICAFYGRAMSPDEARVLINQEAAKEGISQPANLEEKAISLIGRPLYEAFIRGYTTKQWQTDPRELPASIITRLPVRFNFDARYFNDPWEGLPLGGYASLAENLCAHERIQVFTGVDFTEVRALATTLALPVVYTGPIDRYFDSSEGDLQWRTLDFDLETKPTSDFQGTSVVNYVDETVPFTRIHEFRHLHPERAHEVAATTIMHEFSRAASRQDEPYYPVNSPRDKRILDRYRERSRTERNVIFGGRLGSYAYLDMDMALSSALQRYDQEVKPLLRGSSTRGDHTKGL